MISEGSCDTEDWSNDAENSDMITGINYILNIHYNIKVILNCNIFHNIPCVFFVTVFD